MNARYFILHTFGLCVFVCCFFSGECPRECVVCVCVCVCVQFLCSPVCSRAVCLLCQASTRARVCVFACVVRTWLFKHVMCAFVCCVMCFPSFTYLYCNTSLMIIMTIIIVETKVQINKNRDWVPEYDLQDL